MANDQERAAFEAAIERELNYGFDFKQDPSGNYLHDATDTAWIAWQARAALAAAPVQAVPDGWRLVPLAMTPAMEDAAYDATRLPDGTPQFADAGFCLGHAMQIFQAATLAATAAPQVPPESSGPTTHLQRFGDALAMLCAGHRPSDEMMAAWLDIAQDDHRLQEFAIEHGPSWAQGIGVIDAARVLADQPEEDAGHEEAPQVPIDMVLHCPSCGVQHIDEPERSLGPDSTERIDWDNPPHRSHLCHGCGHIWRPADVPTNGVAAIKTEGKADSPITSPGAAPQPAERVPLTDEQAAKLSKLGPVHVDADGLVHRTAQLYRAELERATFRGIRLGEQAHGIRAAGVKEPN